MSNSTVGTKKLRRSRSPDHHLNDLNYDIDHHHLNDKIDHHQNNNDYHHNKIRTRTPKRKPTQTHSRTRKALKIGAAGLGTAATIGAGAAMYYNFGNDPKYKEVIDGHLKRINDAVAKQYNTAKGYIKKEAPQPVPEPGYFSWIPFFKGPHKS